MRPPRLAEWLVRLATSAADREPLLGDLEEEYARRRAEEGPRPAALFYWSEALRAVAPGLGQRWSRYSWGDVVPPARPRRRASRLEAIGVDLKLAARTLARHPRVTATVVLTIAVGIAANTAVFAVIDGVVLRPFPFPEPERLVTVGTVIPKLRQELTFFENLSPAEYLDIVRECRTLGRVVAWDMGNRQVAHGGEGENLFSAFFWGDAFPTLGLAPALGRGFREDEIQRREKVAVVSHRYWSTRLAADPGAVGGPLLVNGEPYTLVGVMPPQTLVYGTDLWLPMPVGPEVIPRPRRQFQVLARIAPGRTLDEVNAELATLTDRLAAAYSREIPEYEGLRFLAATWSDANVRSLKPAALLLAGAALFVLSLACANVASLLLARAAARRREMAVRHALGAGRPALLLQLLSESLLLSLLGGVAGVALAALAVRSLGTMLAALPLPFAPGEIALSARALGYALLASVGSGLAFGLVPALSASRRDPARALRAETPATSGVSRLRAERVLVGLETAGAAVLLVACGLLLRSLDRLARVPPGIAASEIVTFRVTLPRERYDGPAVTRFFRELEERAAGVPGALSAAVAEQYPPIAFSRSRFRVRGAEATADDALPTALLTSVTPSYLATTGLRLRAGRFLTDDDGVGRPLVAVANEEAARRYFGGPTAVGGSFEIGGGGERLRFEIVGVVSDAHNRGLDRPPDPELFLGLYQNPEPSNQHFLLVRARVDPLSLLPALRAEVRALDPEQPIYSVQTVQQALEGEGLPRRVASSLLLVLTVVALVLAGTGIFAVVSHAAASRTREIGLRVALGATAGQVRRLVVRQALGPAALGGLLGLAGAVALTHGVGSLLFGVAPFDPPTLVIAAALLVALAGAASDGPARRAARVDPVSALRVD